jgi:hypothetical protein
MTVAGVTVCTVGAAYLVNMASSSGQKTAVAAFLLGAVLLTTLQIALQRRGDVKARASSRAGSPKAVTLRTRKAWYLVWWGLLFGGVIGIVFDQNPELFSWAPNWLRPDSTKGIFFLHQWQPFGRYQVIVNAVGFAAVFLAGLVEYRWYRLNYIKIDENGIEDCWQEYWRGSQDRFFPGFKNTILTLDWRSVTAVWMDDDGGLHAESDRPVRSIAGAKLPPSATPVPNGRILRLLTAKENRYPVDLDDALVRFGGKKYGNVIPGWTAPDGGAPAQPAPPPPVRRTRGIRRPGS